MHDLADNSTARLRAKQKLTISAIIITTALLGLGSILALETVKSSYQVTIDVLLQLKSDFQTVRQKILEIRRDELYLSEKNQQMIEIQLENIDGLKTHLQRMRETDQTIVKDTTFKFIINNLDQYFISYKKVAEWLIEEGDWNSGKILELESTARSLKQAFANSSQATKDLLVDMETSRIKYIHARVTSAYDQTLHTLASLQSTTSQGAGLLKKYQKELEEINELRWNISLERASFLKIVLMTEHKIQNSIIYIDNYTVEQNASLKALVSNVTWGLLLLVLLTFTGVGISATFFRYLSRQIDKKSEELHGRNQDIAGILNNVKLGIFTINPDGTIHREYSRFLEEILEQNQLEGRTVISTLFKTSNLSSDHQDQVVQVLESSLGEDMLQYETNSHLLPLELTYTSKSGNVKILELQWDHLAENDILKKQMVTIRDVTEIRHMQAESERRKSELNILLEILGQPANKVQSFFNRNQDFVSQPLSNFQNLDDPMHEGLINTIRHSMHTLKGNARTMKFDILANATHQAEDAFKQIAGREQKFQSLEKLNYIFSQYVRVFHDRVLAHSSVKVDSSDELSFIAEQLQETMLSRNPNERLAGLYLHIKKFQGLTTQSVIHKSFDIVPKLTKDEGKAPGILKEKIELIALTEKGAALFQNVLTHLFANSVAHGFESKEERQLARKSPTVGIHIDLSTQANEIKMSFQDDGRGLHLNKLREIAKTLYPQRRFASDADYAELIFESGVSTEEGVTTLAGRGVGMSAVRSFLHDVGGRIDIFLGKPSTDGAYIPIRFEIAIPVVPSLVDETVHYPVITKKAN